ncbi:hypothetical protein [Kushneria phosphatilytica]|uniref:Uncharacterized protein n=1 Tax=Kushneria phosphatilytica TaxID=657387 RepID=A0A1S1NX18_9GAMM|nr:hypothetical protein [Kushneria phosphatilytica]OHV12110.1 hypothetical protein BH688_05515 [Kushneria phosphatilytica]QEL11306.1 hypothetical protein FY550_09260 [Kushneria phosphatilytica]
MANSDTVDVQQLQSTIDELYDKLTSITITADDADKLDGHHADYFATSEQGAKADSAVQSDSLETVATSGLYADLKNKPVLFSGSYSDLTDKPDFSTIATSGSYSDLSDKPDLGTASSSDADEFADAAQGEKADSAVQGEGIAIVLTTTSDFEQIESLDPQTLYVMPENNN